MLGAKALTTKKDSALSSKPAEFLSEYYDLPTTYNKTIVKILAQTPFNLFVYWDLSEEDKNKFKENYGENFFETTKPVLIIHNETMNYSFEVEINDFANSWYLPIKDTKCKYTVELGRRKIFNNFSNNINEPYAFSNNYVQLTSSNIIEAPNDHILFEKKYPIFNNKANITYRNVKTNHNYTKEISIADFTSCTSTIYNNEIYDLYKKMYKPEILQEYMNNKNKFVNNPSSGNISSVAY